MHYLRALAGFFLFIELPIPIYWLIIHPFNSFWRDRVRAALWIAAVTAWTVGGVALWLFRSSLLSPTRRPAPAIAAGLILLGIEVYLFWRAERELGTRR